MAEGQKPSPELSGLPLACWAMAWGLWASPGRAPAWGVGWASPGPLASGLGAVGFPWPCSRLLESCGLPWKAGPLGLLPPSPCAGSPQPGRLPVAHSLSTLQPFLWSGSCTRPSSPRRVSAWSLPGVSLSAMASADTWVPTGREPSSCVWAVRWVPARCRTSATACGSSSVRPAPGPQPPWTPAVPTATAEWGGRPVPAGMLHPSPRGAAEPPAQSACREKPLERQCRHQRTPLTHYPPPRSAATSLQSLWT